MSVIVIGDETAAVIVILPLLVSATTLLKLFNFDEAIAWPRGMSTGAPVVGTQADKSKTSIVVAPGSSL